MVIMGIDPGTATIGYGILKTQVPKHLPQKRSEQPTIIDFGCITTTQFHSTGERLNIIHNEIIQLIKIHNPDLLSVESLYFFKNLKTALPVSQAKGVILLAAAKKKIPVYECTPLQVKMAVVGYGRAEKKQVQEMTKQLLDMSGFDLKEKNRKKDDATDALGVALCGFLKSHSFY